ncbi:unnamed protein product [Chrysodeixis includens]|uniref:Uncharacterized protein n=1 Tax=Chrysodeixis includens TaxID=689277 RepID=A0A9N8Q227_CHRIL|nr:unnamed protein product [Chrysodeixis includens]
MSFARVPRVFGERAVRGPVVNMHRDAASREQRCRLHQPPPASRYITHLQAATVSLPDTGTYCIDYVTSQLTIKHNVRAYSEVISRAVARFAEGGRVIERVGSSRGVDVGEEGARRLRTHRADGYISRSAGARTRAAPPGLVARLAGRAPPRADHAARRPAPPRRD